MIRLISAFFVLLAAVYAGLALKNNPGYVLISINHWTIESTLWFALCALFIILLILHIIWMIINKIIHIPPAIKAFFHAYHLRKEQEKLRKQEFATMEKNLYLSSIQDLANNHREEELVQLIKKMPRNLRHDSTISAAYIRYLIDNQQDAKADAILRKKMNANPENIYIELYGLCKNNPKQLVFAENLLRKIPSSPTLYLCLGRLSMHNRLWGKAKYYLEQSIALEATPEAYRELGMLHEALNDTANACASYKEGIRVIEN